jgi:hypothetical protein
MEQPKFDTVIVPVVVFNDIIKVLSSRPYNEVGNLIKGIEKTVRPNVPAPVVAPVEAPASEGQEANADA